MEEYYKKSIQSVFDELTTSQDGLSNKEVETRIKQFGYNEIKSEKKDSVFKIFLGIPSGTDSAAVEKAK